MHNRKEKVISFLSGKLYLHADHCVPFNADVLLDMVEKSIATQSPSI